MREQLTDELLASEADYLWINENMDALLEKYLNQWIAVKNSRVIASDLDLDKLISKLPDPNHKCVEFITDEPLGMIL
jgi:hypothetical protein